MKVCLLGASFETNNLGVSALAAGAVECILESAPGAEVSLVDYSKEGRTIAFAHGGGQVPIRLVNLRFSYKLWLRNNIARLLAEAGMARLIPTRRLRQAFLGRNPWLEHIDAADWVGAISGGDSFSDIYGLRRFIYVALPQALALLMRKRLVLLPQTLGPFRSRLARAAARYIVRRADAVYSRDTTNTSFMSELNGKQPAGGKIGFCYDVAFALRPQAPARAESGSSRPREGPLVGLNVSGLLYMGGYNRCNMFGLKADYRSLVPRLIDLLAAQKGATVVLVPHVFGSHGESDSTACEQIFAELSTRYGPKLRLVRGSYNQSEIKYVIGQCDFFVGSRMHACLAAVSQFITTLSIAYSDKFSGVMKTVGMEPLVADPRRATEDEILQLLSQAYDRRADYRRQLEATIPVVRRSLQMVFNGITGVASLTSGKPSGASLPKPVELQV